MSRPAGFGTRTRVGVGTASGLRPATGSLSEAYRSLSPGLPLALQQARSRAARTPSPKIGAESESGPLEVPRFQVPFRVSLSPGRPCAFVCVCACACVRLRATRGVCNLR